MTLDRTFQTHLLLNPSSVLARNRTRFSGSCLVRRHLIPGYASLDILSQLILGYPNFRNLYWNIPGYPDLPRVSLFQMNYWFYKTLFYFQNPTARYYRNSGAAAHSDPACPTFKNAHFWHIKTKTFSEELRLTEDSIFKNNDQKKD